MRDEGEVRESLIGGVVGITKVKEQRSKMGGGREKGISPFCPRIRFRWERLLLQKVEQKLGACAEGGQIAVAGR